MDKYIEKIRELKRENGKLKKYKVFVEKSKDTNTIYNEIKGFKKESEQIPGLKKRCNELLSENKRLQSKIFDLNNSQLSFANKSNFYKQQMQINKLEEDMRKLKEEYKDTFERNKILEMIVEKLEPIFTLCDFGDQEESDAELSE